jgi:Fanconi anemia group M protein
MVQRTLKPEDKVLIFVDYREETRITEYVKDMGALIKSIPLKVGDYLCSDRVCVERKTDDDFISSITDGRLFEQAKELKENFSKPIFLIEGNYFKERINENALRSALASIILDYEIPVVMTRNEEESARTIFWLAKREQTITKIGIGISGKKKPKEVKELQEYFISGLPGVSTVLSKRVLKEFKSIKSFANAKENEISKVKGIGKSLAKNLYKILNEEYGGNA